MAGGKDKNLPWDLFAQEVPGRVSFLIGFGQSGPMIVNVVQERARYSQQSAPNCAVVRRLDEAVELAARIARPSCVVLLSPGGTSYDAYKNFEERGDHFRQLVQQVSEAKTPAHANGAPNRAKSYDREYAILCASKAHYDWGLLTVVVTLLMFGLVMVFSASFAYGIELQQNPYYFVLMQIAWISLGLLP